MSRENPEPWIPETNQLRLAALGKLMEECGELTSAAARCMIQGIDGAEPETGKPNRQWLGEEIADVLSCAALVTAVFGLNEKAVDERSDMKSRFLLRWLEIIPKEPVV